MPNYLDNLKEKYKDPMVDFTEDERDYFNERAGIYQYCANFTREQAESLALIAVQARRARLEVEREINAQAS